MSSQEEYSRRLRERSRSTDEAIEAARSAARGMGRAETRQRVVAELRARGLMLPPPEIDLILHDVMLGTGLTAGMRRAVWHLANATDLVGRAVRFVSAAARHQPLPHLEFGRARYLKPDLHLREDVILDPAAQESLAVGAGDLIGDDDVIEVWLDCPRSIPRPAADAATDATGGDDDLLVVYYGEERVGVLGPEASSVYRRDVCEARDAGVIPIVPATRSRAGNGSWQLRVGVPLPI